MANQGAGNRIRLNRLISWTLLLVAIGTILTGYLSARGIIPHLIIAPFHLVIEVLFVALLIGHLILSLLTKFYWKNTFHKIRIGTATSLNWLKLIQRLTGFIIVGFAFLVIISGLDWYALGLGSVYPFTQHLNMDIFLTSLLIIHVGIGAKFALARRQIRGSRINAALLLAILLPTILIGVWDSGGKYYLMIQLAGTQPTLESNLVWVDDQQFSFNPTEVNTLRPDLFKPGYFSAFDVLVHLADQGFVNLEYHFNESMNTYLIDTINGEVNWWYRIWYDGGWPEENVFRMDHYPWKDGTWLKFVHIQPNRLAAIYQEFRAEVARFNETNGSIIIPQVEILGNLVQKIFYNVTVTPHNLRNDVFQDGVITAIDIIMSLGDQDLITYDLQWYESIGTAGIVKSYWIDGINQDLAYGRCGFVYETGSFHFRNNGNHIHLPSDTRILNSPEYGIWIWICI